MKRKEIILLVTFSILFMFLAVYFHSFSLYLIGTITSGFTTGVLAWAVMRDIRRKDDD